MEKIFEQAMLYDFMVNCLRIIRRKFLKTMFLIICHSVK